jgi:hypothetical protein
MQLNFNFRQDLSSASVETNTYQVPKVGVQIVVVTRGCGELFPGHSSGTVRTVSINN